MSLIKYTSICISGCAIRIVIDNLQKHNNIITVNHKENYSVLQWKCSRHFSSRSLYGTREHIFGKMHWGLIKVQRLKLDSAVPVWYYIWYAIPLTTWLTNIKVDQAALLPGQGVVVVVAFTASDLIILTFQYFFVKLFEKILKHLLEEISIYNKVCISLSNMEHVK